MRVLNPGPGEIVDRLTVVARKIVEGGGKHFHAEMFELTKAIKELTLPIEPEEINFQLFIVNIYALAATNAAIWQREDELREMRGKFISDSPSYRDFVNTCGEEIAELAFRIQELNDQRAELVKEINKAAGINREEKL